MRDGRLHDARHTAATVLVLLGVHERTIMSVLGWSTTAMVSRHAHVIAPMQTDLAARLDGLLWASPPDISVDQLSDDHPRAAQQPPNGMSVAPSTVGNSRSL